MTPARVEWFHELGSTNTELEQRLETEPQAWPDFSVLGTDFQNAGLARRDRTWIAAPGTALTFSVPYTFPAGAATADFGWVPLAVGWAVATTLRAHSIPASVKWPNDVLVGDKKICGILCRLVPGARTGDGAPSQPTVIIGIGLNVGMTAEQLPVVTATSVAVEGADIDRETLLAELLDNLRQALAALFTDGQAPAATGQAKLIRDLMGTLGADVNVHLPNESILTGTARGLDEHGDLIIENSAGRHSVSAGDVVHVRRA